MDAGAASALRAQGRSLLPAGVADVQGAFDRGESIEVYALEPAFLDALEAVTDRNTRWELVHTEGQLYVTVGGESVSGAVTRHALLADG